MSMDNGTYVVKFFDGYRVANCQAIDNLVVHGDLEHAIHNFGKSQVYPTLADALQMAEAVEDAFADDMAGFYGVPVGSEYGVCVVESEATRAIHLGQEMRSRR